MKALLLKQFKELQVDQEQRFYDQVKIDELTGEHPEATALDYFAWTSEETYINDESDKVYTKYLSATEEDSIKL